jgi:hypothetical protein
MVFPTTSAADCIYREGQEIESASGEARGGGRLGALMRGPISEAIIIVALGFFIGGIAGAIIHFTFDSSNAIVPHPASGHALGGLPDYPKQ